jgi:hypothetical protein
VRVTAPREAEVTRIDDAPIGVPLFDSWVVLGGVLPIDRHHFVIARVDRGRGFHERRGARRCVLSFVSDDRRDADARRAP